MKKLMIIALSIVCCITTIGTYAQKVGFLMDSYVIDRWYIDQKLFTDRISALGGECLVEMPYGDADEQVRLGKKLLAAGVKVLVIIAVDAKKAAEIASAASALKVPVIAYDRLIAGEGVSFYISYNNELVGRLQAGYGTERKPAGNYMMVNGPVSDNNAILFREGQLRVLKPFIESKRINLLGDIVLDGWSEIETLMKMDEYFTSDKPKPDVIIAANDAIASGVIQALPPDLLGKVIVTGQDADITALKNIIAGKQSMTIYKPIKPLAHQAAESAMKLAKGEKLSNTVKFRSGNMEVDAILLTPVMVDKLNYKETVIKDGHVNMSVLLEKK